MALISLRRIRTAWQLVRPLPLPRYVPGTPKIDAYQHIALFQSPNPLTPLTLTEAATSQEAITFVTDLLDKLTPDEEGAGLQAFYRSAQAQFGRYWRFADLYTTLWAAATFIQPTSYLEIGVRRGRSAAVLGATCPDCSIYGFDLWTPDYIGTPNPGPDFVRGELRASGHRGTVELISGDSRNTVPAFLLEHPDLYFDLITVDGTKSLMGVAADFANVLPRLKVGGVVVYDDLPYVPILRRVWNKLIQGDGRYVGWAPTGAGGVAAALRIADEPWRVAMRRLTGR
jgi:predicted O-methyltransferase YrrM